MKKKSNKTLSSASTNIVMAILNACSAIWWMFNPLYFADGASAVGANILLVAFNIAFVVYFTVYGINEFKEYLKKDDK